MDQKVVDEKRNSARIVAQITNVRDWGSVPRPQNEQQLVRCEQPCIF